MGDLYIKRAPHHWLRDKPYRVLGEPIPEGASLGERGMGKVFGEKAYFLTVVVAPEMSGPGRRGIFCNVDGQAFSKDDSPHAEGEMQDILGPPYWALKPMSLLFTSEEVLCLTEWIPLEEYCGEFGVAAVP